MYCQNCGHQLPDNARFCDKCGAPVGQDNGHDMQPESGGLKFQDDMVMRDGTRMPTNRAQNRQPMQSVRKKRKSGGKAVFFVLCVLIVALSAGIAWEVFTLVEINRGTSEIEFPKLQTESTVTEADSEAESAL